MTLHLLLDWDTYISDMRHLTCEADIVTRELGHRGHRLSTLLEYVHLFAHLWIVPAAANDAVCTHDQFI